MAEFKPLYRKTLDIACMMGDLDQWRASRQENIACARSIDAAIRDGYDGMHLRDGIAKEIAEAYGLDRTAWVLAATLHEMKHDGRYSNTNKAWGEAQRISNDVRAYEYICNAHPVLVNDFIDDFRKLQQESIQTPDTMNIRIFQINHNRDSEHLKFMSLDYLEGKPIDSSTYDRVFSGEIAGRSLEDVFRMFNTEGHPLHRGHSLSVSDIVELRLPVGETEAGFYYCDSIGFEKVDFDPDQTLAPENLCRILFIEPGRKPYESEVVDDLPALQKAVGGLIEPTYPFDCDGDDNHVVLVGNEEAKLENLPPNRRVYGSVYCGNIFLIGDDMEGGFISLNDEQIQKYGEMFAQPEDISPEEVQTDKGFLFGGF